MKRLLQCFAGPLCVAILPALFLNACATPRHQKGGQTSQSLGTPAVYEPATPATQTLAQSENPKEVSTQEIRETVTTTAPTGEVVTTVKHAKTTLGGSQDLAEIMKEYTGSEYVKRIALALILGCIAFAVRKEWPSLQWVFGLGAVAVAFFGPIAVIAVAGIGGGIVFAYHVVKSNAQIHLP